MFRKYPPARTIHPSSRSPYSGHTNALCRGKVCYKSSAAQRITYRLTRPNQCDTALGAESKLKLKQLFLIRWF